jgi:hypothetical protein
MVRHSDMKSLSLMVAAGLVVVLGAASCSSPTLRLGHWRPGGPAADVTGFASARLPPGSPPSGPVTVRITGMEASRLALLVSQLPSVAQSQVHCEEPLGLMYRISFGVGLLAPSKAVVEGYRCGAGVTVRVAGKASSWRRDANCTLIRAVRLVLPARAKATHSLSIGCGS